jgi:hypothetical protein
VVLLEPMRPLCVREQGERMSEEGGGKSMKGRAAGALPDSAATPEQSTSSSLPHSDPSPNQSPHQKLQSQALAGTQSHLAGSGRQRTWLVLQVASKGVLERATGLICGKQRSHLAGTAGTTTPSSLTQSCAKGASRSGAARADILLRVQGSLLGRDGSRCSTVARLGLLPCLRLLGVLPRLLLLVWTEQVPPLLCCYDLHRAGCWQHARREAGG